MDKNEHKLRQSLRAAIDMAVGGLDAVKNNS